jgi:hypothetical protein
VQGKKSRRSAPSRLIKAENGDLPEGFPNDFPGLHGLFVAVDNDEYGDESLSGSDMLSLKGQVWPGMGKMDLANEEMKRTRNQRKPKSVVEKMRRASEGIQPTQVVMTSQFDIERIKGVYDDESPVSDVEETVSIRCVLNTPMRLTTSQPTPRRTTRQRRKRPQPLAELSVNVPRGNVRRTARGGAGFQGRQSKHTLMSGLEPVNTSFGSLKRSHDTLCNDTRNGTSNTRALRFTIF